MSTQPSCPACGHDELNGHAICPKCGADAAGMAHFAQKWERGETGGDGKLRTTLVWTRYDGTDTTLPEEGPVVLYWRDGYVPFPAKHERHNDGRPVVVQPDIIRRWWFLFPGDLWAYIPERPAAPEAV